MRPRPWLLLCVSLHGVAASVYELRVRSSAALVVGGRRHGGAGGHRRERSDPGIRARLAGAALRASALTPIAGGDTPEIHVRTKLEARNDVRPRTADYEMKPMLCDETEEEIPGASFAALAEVFAGGKPDDPTCQQQAPAPIKSP